MVKTQWPTYSLLDLCNVYIGLTHTPRYVDHGIPFLSAKDLNKGKLDFSDAKQISKEEFSIISNASKPQKGDIVFGRVGTLGNPCIVEKQTDFAIFVSLGYMRPKPGVMGAYLCQWMRSDFFMKQVEEKIAGSSQKNLNTGWLREFSLLLPSLKEQQQIVGILSDIDNTISLYESLLSKKRLVKQGAMQELLTGKKRLPGFTGKWQNFNLMKHSKIKARIGWQGLKKSEYLDSGYALLVTGTDFADGKVQWDSCHYVTRDRYDQDRNIQIQNNDILITKDGSLGKAALVQGLTKPATLNSGIFVIRPLQNAYDPVFVYHILSSFVFKNFLDKLSAGSTIIHLYQKDVGKFEFLLPPTMEEQKAIAAVLSEMDADIAALEEKLAKYRQVKQGMMQQLLTGKIRLV